jgi:cytochrome c oxidase assembly protein subunit 15
MEVTHYNPIRHRTAQLTVAATLLLIFMGGLVTSHRAGLAVPDWPNSYGYNMFTFPISKWVGGIFYEHVNRLMGTVVGFCSILVMLSTWGFGADPTIRRRFRMAATAMIVTAAACLLLGAFGPKDTDFGRRITHAGTQVGIFSAGLGLVCGCALLFRSPDPRRWARWFSVGLVGGVIFQGILGGLRVLLVDVDLAIVHACVAQVFLCLGATMCVIHSRFWVDGYREHPDGGHGLIRLATFCTVAIFAQLMVGAMMRHYDAGLAVPDFPLSYGEVLPPVDRYDLTAANEFRAKLDPPLPPTTLGKTWLHSGHRFGALLVTAVLGLLMYRVLRYQRQRLLRRLAWGLMILLPVQITLGALTVLWRKPADIASIHVAIGAMTLMTTAVLLLRAARLYSPLWRPAPAFPVIRVTPNPMTVTA